MSFRCYKCGHPTKFVTIIEIKRGMEDNEITTVNSSIVRSICSSCAKELDDWFE